MYSSQAWKKHATMDLKLDPEECWSGESGPEFTFEAILATPTVSACKGKMSKLRYMQKHQVSYVFQTEQSNAARDCKLSGVELERSSEFIRKSTKRQQN